MKKFGAKPGAGGKSGAVQKELIGADKFKDRAIKAWKPEKRKQDILGRCKDLNEFLDNGLYEDVYDSELEDEGESSSRPSFADKFRAHDLGLQAVGPKAHRKKWEPPARVQPSGPASTSTSGAKREQPSAAGGSEYYEEWEEYRGGKESAEAPQSTSHVEEVIRADTEKQEDSVSGEERTAASSSQETEAVSAERARAVMQMQQDQAAALALHNADLDAQSMAQRERELLWEEEHAAQIAARDEAMAISKALELSLMDMQGEAGIENEEAAVRAAISSTEPILEETVSPSTELWGDSLEPYVPEQAEMSDLDRMLAERQRQAQENRQIFDAIRLRAEQAEAHEQHEDDLAHQRQKEELERRRRAEEELERQRRAEEELERQWAEAKRQHGQRAQEARKAAREAQRADEEAAQRARVAEEWRKHKLQELARGSAARAIQRRWRAAALWGAARRATSTACAVAEVAECTLHVWPRRRVQRWQAAVEGARAAQAAWTAVLRQPLLAPEQAERARRQQSFSMGAMQAGAGMVAERAARVLQAAWAPRRRQLARSQAALRIQSALRGSLARIHAGTRRRAVHTIQHACRRRVQRRARTGAASLIQTHWRKRSSLRAEAERSAAVQILQRIWRHNRVRAQQRHNITRPPPSPGSPAGSASRVVPLLRDRAAEAPSTAQPEQKGSSRVSDTRNGLQADSLAAAESTKEVVRDGRGSGQQIPGREDKLVERLREEVRAQAAASKASPRMEGEPSSAPGSRLWTPRTNGDGHSLVASPAGSRPTSGKSTRAQTPVQAAIGVNMVFAPLVIPKRRVSRALSVVRRPGEATGGPGEALQHAPKDLKPVLAKQHRPGVPAAPNGPAPGKDLKPGSPGERAWLRANQVAEQQQQHNRDKVVTLVDKLKRKTTAGSTANQGKWDTPVPLMPCNQEKASKVRGYSARAKPRKSMWA